MYPPRAECFCRERLCCAQQAAGDCTVCTSGAAGKRYVCEHFGACELSAVAPLPCPDVLAICRCLDVHLDVLCNLTKMASVHVN
jgi:hypothetical protein